MDLVDKKKTVKYFFDTAPDCCNERVNIIDYQVGNLYEKKSMVAGRNVMTERNGVTGGNHLTFVFT